MESNENITIFHSGLCAYEETESFWNFVKVFENSNCYRHSFGLGLFLFLVNFVIFVFGLLGNVIVIYVVIWKIANKTASSIFILNLAVADLLVIVGCIPATVISNLITPWILGEVMCKIMAYGQGVSVFCSVFSLVAISFDRVRAVSKSGTQNQSISQAVKIVGVIWIVGVTVVLPWAIVFKVVKKSSPIEYIYDIELPYCQEVWPTTTFEILFFLLECVFLCYCVPLALIIYCDVVIWRNVMHVSGSNSSSVPSQLNSCASAATNTQRQRKVRVLKMFTALTSAFFLFWLPLYVIMARVKFAYSGNFHGSLVEHQVMSILIPISQLMGSCNSCVNPVLYALLNQTFRESFKRVFACIPFGVTAPTPTARSGTATPLEINGDVRTVQSSVV